MSVEKKYFIVDLMRVRFDVLFPLQTNVTLSICHDFSMLCHLDMPTQY